MASMDIHEHGVYVDKKKYRLKCNYCGKEMHSFHRLKFHLGGVRGMVTPCEQVTDAVRETFRRMIMDERSVVTTWEAQKCITRFFYENCIDSSVVDSPSFKEMMTVRGGKIPDSHDLNGWMLQEALKEMQDRVKKIKDSWEVTGCSILLDAWVDQQGRDLVTFVADSPAGPVYLKSFDVSHIKSNSDALISLVDGVVDEVGMHNVIQIIACSTSGWVGEVGESFASNNKKKQVFWSVSVSHCFELMLAKIVKMDDSLVDIVDKVDMITEFINNNHGIDMTVSSYSSEFEFVMPYLTLESIFKAKNDLAAMFASYDWNKEEEDITIYKLVNDSSLWETVERVVKCTSPLIQGLLWFSAAKNQHVGNIHDTMDCIKESIAKEFNHNKLCYMSFWNVIDDVWNKHLHIPLHAAGYFLNPTAFYSTDFHLDQEVATGLISTLVYMVKECSIQVKSCHLPHSLICTASVKTALTRPFKLIKALQLSDGLKRRASTQNCRVSPLRL